MKTKLFTLLLALVASIRILPAEIIEHVQIGDLYYNLNYTQQIAEVTYQEYRSQVNYSSLTVVDIPASVTYNDVTYNVRSIGEMAFYDCGSIASIALPNTITSVGNYAFSDCTELISIEIPNSVISLGNYAFYNCSSLTSIEIPNSVISLGNYAFYNCSSLTSIEIPNSVTNVGEGAFMECHGLTSVHINDLSAWCNISFEGHESNPLCYAQNLYLNGELITDLVIPYDVTDIKSYAFDNCTCLASVTIPNGITSIGNSAFSGCSGITSIKWNAKNCNGGIFGTQVESFTFGDSVEVIPANLCQGMNRLTTITIPNCVKNIENSAFEGCSGIISVTLNSNAIVSKEYPYSSLKNIFGEQVKTYVIGDSVTSIGREAFFACTSLTSVTIGNNVTTIGYRAFARCSGLTSIEIPNSVTSIGEGTFANCSGLTSITIPESVTSIGDYAFLLCTGLTSVYISNLAAWCDISFEYSGSWDQSSNPFYYAHNLYLNDEIITDLVIPDSVLSIKNYAFYGCSDLTSVTIPKSVRSIGEYAFQNCTGLTSVYISDLAAWCEISFEHNVYSMDKATSNPLYYAHNLYLNGEIITNLVIPNSVFSIKNYAFSGCSALTSVTIPNCVTNIGRETFCDCSSLHSVTIPNSVVNIGNYAFSGCSALTSVTIPNNVTNIGDYVFKGCIGLTSVTIPKSVTRIGSNAFNGCCSITSVTWNAKNCNAYNFGSHVESFILGDSVEVIPANLCDGMNKLRTMAIPNSVASIGSNAFNGCSSITSVTWNAKNCNAYNFGTQVTSFTFGENVEVIPASLCSGMSLLTEIIIPNSVTSIGNNAFNGCNGITSVIWNAKNCNAYNFGTQVTSFTFGENVEVIPANLCDGMNKLQSLPFGKNIKRIGNNAFRGCENVSTLSLPSSLKFIGNEAFSGWKKITKLNIPNDVDSIGSRAFENCIYVTSIYLGNKITEIGDYAFNGCTRVNDITCMNTVTPTVYANTLSSINSLAYLYVRAGSKRTYQLDPYWGRFDIQELTTDESTLTKDEVIIEAHDDNAVFTWPMNTAAATYSLQITKAGEVFCTLTFNSNGQLTGIAFAPYRNGAPHTPAATTSISGMSFTVTGLDVATRYEYNLTIKDNQQQVIKDYSGRFATQGYVPEKYTITFINWDGAELLTLTEVEEGTIPAYTGATPTRQETAEFAYTFAGWTPEIVAATSDTTYTATYTATRKSYTITWQNEDGTMIDQTTVEYGVVPTHADPTKEATAEYSYTFAGWTPDVVAVTGDATYRATFNATKNKYLIVFQDEDGTELKSGQVEYGEMPIAPAAPSKPADSEYIYTFASWTPEIVVVTKDAMYTATYDATPVSEGIDDVSSKDIAPRKVMVDGNVYILRGDKIYTLQGQELR